MRLVLLLSIFLVSHLFGDTPLYQITVPVVDEGSSVGWVYEAKKRSSYKSNYDPLFYDESAIRHQLAIFSLFQHEAPYLREWIEYHKLLGVEHFYLYNNLSNDNYLQVLEPYIVKGEVTLVQWPYKDPEGASPYFWCEMQKRAYENALERARGRYRWMAFIDTDEFLVPIKHDSLTEFLSEYEPYGGVVVNWMMYGTSYVEKIEPGELMIDKLVMRSHANIKENENVKSIVKPHRVKWWPCPHWCEYKSGFYSVDPRHVRAKPGQYNSARPVDIIRINHYWFRDSGFFWNVKVPRWQKTAWQITEEGFRTREEYHNAVYDPTIRKYVPRLKKRMEKQEPVQKVEKEYRFFAPIVSDERDIRWMFEACPIRKTKTKRKMRFTLSLYAVLHNNAPILRDWIEYHKMMGVEHFYLYNTLSDDDYVQVLQPYLQSGEVELIQWPRKEVNGEMFEDCLRRAYKKSKWLVTLHPYETLVADGFLGQYLPEFDHCDAVSIQKVVVGPKQVQETFQAFIKPDCDECMSNILQIDVNRIRIDSYPHRTATLDNLETG